MTFDQDVPVPQEVKTGPKRRMDLAGMEVGWSLFVSTNAERKSLCYIGKKNHGYTMVSQKEGDGYRIWRTA